MVFSQMSASKIQNNFHCTRKSGTGPLIWNYCNNPNAKYTRTSKWETQILHKRHNRHEVKSCIFTWTVQSLTNKVVRCQGQKPLLAVSARIVSHLAPDATDHWSLHVLPEEQCRRGVGGAFQSCMLRGAWAAECLIMLAYSVMCHWPDAAVCVWVGGGNESRPMERLTFIVHVCNVWSKQLLFDQENVHRLQRTRML